MADGRKAGDRRSRLDVRARDAPQARARGALLAGLVAALTLTACSRPPAEGEWYSTWDLDGGCRSRLPGSDRLDARGSPADFCHAAGEGRWVWVYYGAPWCSSSVNQAARMRGIEQRSNGRLIVYSVLTSGPEPLSIPRQADASAWARKVGLSDERVLFDPAESDPRTVPQHLLIGPDGRTWWRWHGPLDAETLLERFESFADGRVSAQTRPLPPLDR